VRRRGNNSQEDGSEVNDNELIYFEGELYAKRDLQILLKSRRISKRITARRVTSELSARLRRRQYHERS
jgi:hypothetical protein